MSVYNPDGPIIIPDEYDDNTFGITSMSNYGYDDDDDEQDDEDLSE